MNQQNKHEETSEESSLLDLLLRRPTAILTEIQPSRRTSMLLTLSAFALGGVTCYGLIVGSFSGGMQWWASPIKLCFGFFVSALMCFPSFYIFLCMSGAKISARQIVVLLITSLALAGILMVAVLPISWVFTQASESIGFMGTLHLAVWGIALLAIGSSLGNGFRRLEAQSLALIRVWMVIFMLVTLQMTTTLRPVLGEDPNFFPSTKKFFLTHWADTLREGIEHY